VTCNFYLLLLRRLNFYLDIFHSSRVAACLPNLKLLSLEGFPNNVNPQLLLQLEGLTTLHMSYGRECFRILAHVGQKLKELRFPVEIYLRCDSWPALKVFELCPNLEIFEYYNFAQRVDFEVPLVAESLKLKKLHLRGDFSEAAGFLPLVLRAPLLEDVSLKFLRPFVARGEFETLIKHVSLGDMFKNLVKVQLGFFPLGEDITLRDLLPHIENLAKHIISYCPKLETADFDFKTLSEDVSYKANNSVTPFHDVLKMI